MYRTLSWLANLTDPGFIVSYFMGMQFFFFKPECTIRGFILWVWTPITDFYHKFYLDEIYQALFVGPLQVICWGCRGADWLLDNLVDCVARIPLGLGKLTSAMQNGLVQLYALWMIGVTALLLWVMIVLRG